jgi:hypothetical protein
VQRSFLFILAVALASSACIRVHQQQVEVTPGTVPAEVEGAKWPDMPIAYCIVAQGQGGFVSNETLVALTQRALEAWGVATSYEGECGGPLTHGNGRNEIGWGELGGDPLSLAEAGNTNIRYRSSLLGGAPDIIEADITIEREPPRGKATEECLYTTLLHETGHVLGLPHLDASTVMAPVIQDCLQELTPVDLTAINELY